MEVITTSPWVPVEWIAAHGHEPRGAWFAAEDLRMPAVPEGVCAFAQTMVALARSKPQSAVIFTTACDQMRRAADSVAGETAPRTFLFNVPATWQTDAARRLFHAEVERLGRFLVRLGGHAPTEVELNEAIRRCEARRAQVRSIMAQNSAWNGAQMIRRCFGDFEAATECFPDHVSPHRSPPARREGEGKGGPNAPKASADDFLPLPATRNVPLALLGGPLFPQQWFLFDAIEAAGGSVVLNATEPGERALLPPVPNSVRESPLPRLVDHYFDHIVDVFQRPHSRLYDWLAPRLAGRGVRGLVLWVHVGCDLWRAEAASLRESFGLPVLVLEAHELHAGNLRDASRLAAFIESLTAHSNPGQNSVAYTTKCGATPISGRGSARSND